MSNGSLKVSERAGGIAHLHVHAGDLDQTLHIVGLDVQTLFEIGLGTDRVTEDELVCPSHVVGERLTVGPVGADTLLDGLVDEHEGLAVISRSLGFGGQLERVVTSVDRVRRQDGGSQCRFYRDRNYYQPLADLE